MVGKQHIDCILHAWSIIAATYQWAGNSVDQILGCTPHCHIHISRHTTRCFVKILGHIPRCFVNTSGH